MMTSSFKNQICSNLKDLRLRNTKEAVTLSKIIDPIIDEAGFRTIDIQSVEEEFNAQIDNSLYAIEIDRCLKSKGIPRIFIQCKQIGSKHKIKYDYEKTFEAAKSKQIPYVIFTDSLYWEIYKLCHVEYKLNGYVNLLYDSFQYQKIVSILQYLRKETHGSQH